MSLESIYFVFLISSHILGIFHSPFFVMLLHNTLHHCLASISRVIVSWQRPWWRQLKLELLYCSDVITVEMLCQKEWSMRTRGLLLLLPPSGKSTTERTSTTNSPIFRASTLLLICHLSSADWYAIHHLIIAPFTVVFIPSIPVR